MGAERKIVKNTVFFFVGNVTTTKNFTVQFLLSRNFVVIAQAPIYNAPSMHTVDFQARLKFSTAIVIFERDCFPFQDSGPRMCVCGVVLGASGESETDHSGRGGNTSLSPSIYIYIISLSLSLSLSLSISKRYLAYLPLAHIMEMIVEVLSAQNSTESLWLHLRFSPLPRIL